MTMILYICQSRRIYQGFNTEQPIRDTTQGWWTWCLVPPLEQFSDQKAANTYYGSERSDYFGYLKGENCILVWWTWCLTVVLGTVVLGMRQSIEQLLCV